jgi:uncharacterized protein YjiS (DUF1127 family)
VKKMIANTLHSGTESGVHASVRAADWVASQFREFSRWRAQRRAISDLRRLDDRTLRDIGIHRSQIKGAVCGHMTIYRGE